MNANTLIELVQPVSLSFFSCLDSVCMNRLMTASVDHGPITGGSGDTEQGSEERRIQNIRTAERRPEECKIANG